MDIYHHPSELYYVGPLKNLLLLIPRNVLLRDSQILQYPENQVLPGSHHSEDLFHVD